MPIYVYECASCGQFEEHQSMSAPSLTECPQCGDSVKRVFGGGTSYVMRGEGGAGSHCDRKTPCCGRQTRCDSPPCK